MKESIIAFTKTKSFNYTSSAFLISLYTYFLYNHAIALLAGTISPVVLIFMIMETVVIYLLIIRTVPKERTGNVYAWAIALVGTFLPLLFIPAGTTINFLLGTIFMLCGGALAIGAYLSLNQSFGIVPAKRNIKVSGMYRIVRHPMYLSYFIIYIGYLLLVCSLFNVIVFCFLIFCLLLRIMYEEILLRSDDTYVAYTKKVRYRLLPFLF